jgi:hypothetical protein
MKCLLRRLFPPSSLPVALLGLHKLQVYRRWWGGHWELWWVDFPIAADIWHDVVRCSVETGKRPNALLMGTPTCENF